MTEDDENGELESEDVKFLFSVVSVEGINPPRPISIELSGFVGSPVQSKPEVDRWQFHGQYELSCRKELKLESVAHKRTGALRPQLLDELCNNALKVRILEREKELGSARFTLEALIHYDSMDRTVVLKQPIVWNDLSEEKVLVDGDVPVTQEVYDPESKEEEIINYLSIKVTINDPIGRKYCPEDFQDWAKLSVTVHGLYSLPNDLQDIDGPIDRTNPGIMDTHPFSYHFRMMGLNFDNGYLFNPPIPPGEEEEEKVAQEECGEEDKKEPTDGENADPVGDENEEDGEQSIKKEESVEEDPLLVDMPTLIEGLEKMGYTSAQEDGAEIFEFLDQNKNGAIGVAEFCQLKLLDTPADIESMIVLRRFLLDKCGTLRKSFDRLKVGGIIPNEEEGEDGEEKEREEGEEDDEPPPLTSQEAALMEDHITLESLEKGLLKMGYEGNNAVSLYMSLDLLRTKVVTWSEFQTLHLFEALDRVTAVEKQRDWILEVFGDMQSAIQQIDENRTRRVSLDEWIDAMKNFGYANEVGEDANMCAAFDFMDSDGTKIVGKKEFDFLADFDGKSFLKDLQEFRQYFHDLHHDLEKTWSKMCGKGRSKLKAREFNTACKRLGYKGKLDPRTVFNFLDENHSGTVGEGEFLLLHAFNSAAAKGALPKVKNYIMERFGDLDMAFKLMFGDPTEFFEIAENKLPRVEWEEESRTQHCYKGREWLQEFYNILNDIERGRIKLPEKQAGGVWLYMFPKLKDQDLPVPCYKTTQGGPDAINKARVARWHHGQMFVNLKKFTTDDEVRETSTLIFRAFISRVAEQCADVNQDEDLPASPFEYKRTYMKITLSFDRILPILCPRGVAPLESGYVPDPPAPIPPKSVMDQFEEEIGHMIARIAYFYAHTAREIKASKEQISGPDGQKSEYALMGPVPEQHFLKFLVNSGHWDALSAIIRKCTHQLMHERVKQGEHLPCSGLYGDERDSKYTNIRDDMLHRIVSRLNEAVQTQQWRRETKFWRSPPLYGDGDDNFWEPEDIKLQQLARCKQLARLVFECELYCDHDRARSFWQERLRLPHNVHDPGLWYTYARFLVRCGQHQPMAEQALRYSISLQTVEKADADSILFLACVLLNRTGKCSLPDEPTQIRFEAALSMFTIFASRNVMDPTGNFFMYLLYAMEAKFRLDAGLNHYNQEASAAKYLAISKAPRSFFTNILPSLRQDSRPHFPELTELFKQERIARDQLKEREPRKSLKLPDAWKDPSFPAFSSYDNVHKAPLPEDEVVLDAIDKVLQFGMPNFVRFLIREGVEVYHFISPETVASDRCRMQLVKAHMMLGEFKEAGEVCNTLLHENTDRLVEAWILLGEAEYRLALDLEQKQNIKSVDNPHYQKSLEAFHKALGFLPQDAFRDPEAIKIQNERTTSEAVVSNRDPVIYIRTGSVYYARQQYEEAKNMYMRSLEQAPTAEGWRNAGVAAYRLASQAKKRGEPEKEDAYFAESFTCLLEANIMDNTRPKIWAWLCICAIEKGERYLAKQAFRHASRVGIDWDTSKELAERLVHFSNEKNAEYEGGSKFVEDGLYAQEAQIILEQMHKEKETGETYLLLGRTYLMQHEYSKGVGELRMAAEVFENDLVICREIYDEIQPCLKYLHDQPNLIQMIKESNEALKEKEEALAVKLKAEEEARIRAEEEARIQAEEEARLRAEEEARIRAEEEARLQAEEQEEDGQ